MPEGDPQGTQRVESWKSPWSCAAARRAASRLLEQNTGDFQQVAHALGFLRQLVLWRTTLLQNLGFPEEAIIGINQYLRLLVHAVPLLKPQQACAVEESTAI